MKKYIEKLKKIVAYSFARKWFLTLLSVFAALFLCFIISTRSNSEKALIAEYTNYSELQTERTAEHLDDYFYSYSRITALLSINDTIHLYLFAENANKLFSDIYDQIYYILASYKEGFSAIDSIFLFPASGKEIFSSNSSTARNSVTLEDTNCLSLAEAPDSLTFVPREKNGRYPYLMTLYMPLYESTKGVRSKSMIVLNINISNIPILQNSTSDSFQSVYIVSDEGELLYRNKQRDMPESIELVEELCHFDSSVDSYSKYVDGDSPYIYVQQHSSKYPWYYITVTTPQGYADKSTNLHDSLFSLLPWLMLFSLVAIVGLVLYAIHPIHTISEFLENPHTEVPENISEPETQKIIRQFINYIQTNHSLSDELTRQMELQNKATFVALQSQINPHFLFNTLNIIRNMEIETLGYDHEAPELTLTLSRLLQYALGSSELVSLKTEFYYTDLYLKILNQRYKNKLQFIVRKDADASEILVPKLILQPLIENAIFHGCSPKLEEHNRILVDAKMDADRCIIMIQDNGIGISEDNLDALRQKINDSKNIPSDSIGLQNVALRMYLTYGDDFKIDIDSTPGAGTCVTLFFPA